MLRRLFLFLACGLGLAGLAARAADAEFVRIWPQWQEAAAFERLGEFFGGAEPQGRERVLRSRAGERAGYYFLVRVKHAAPLAGATFALQVIRPDAPQAVSFTFPVGDAGKGETVFQLGLTGADWPGGKNAQPVAWKLELRDASGRPLVTQKSFLWEKPAK